MATFPNLLPNPYELRGWGQTVDTELTDREILITAVSGNISAATDVFTFQIPYAMTLTGVKAYLVTAPAGSNTIIDINDDGTSVFDTDKLNIDDGENSSDDSTTTPTIANASIASGSIITVDVDQVGSGTAGADLTIWLIGTKG